VVPEKADIQACRDDTSEREELMGDKSPGRSLKKAGKSIKEKRAERRAKGDATTQMERLSSGRKS
jgi:hypothetical protein